MCSERLDSGFINIKLFFLHCKETQGLVKKMNTRTIALISIVAVVLASASLLLILMSRTPDSNVIPLERGQITYVTFTVGDPNGMISAIFNSTSTSKITINTVYVNNTQQLTWTCYVNGVATSPATVPRDSGAQFNITTTVVAGSQYDIKLIDSLGNTYEYTGIAPS